MKKLLSIVSSGLIGVAVAASSAGPSAAGTFRPGIAASAGNVIQVQGTDNQSPWANPSLYHPRGARHWRGHRGSRYWRHHGHWRHHHPRYHRHRGDIGAVIGGLAAGAIIGGALAHQGPRYYGGGSAHVEWCLDRYRSYDPRSDTFQPYHGPRRKCHSPYG